VDLATALDSASDPVIARDRAMAIAAIVDITDPATVTTAITDPATDPATDMGTDPATDPATDMGTDPATDMGTDPVERMDTTRDHTARCYQTISSQVAYARSRPTTTQGTVARAIPFFFSVAIAELTSFRTVQRTGAISP